MYVHFAGFHHEPDTQDIQEKYEDNFHTTRVDGLPYRVYKAKIFHNDEQELSSAIEAGDVIEYTGKDGKVWLRNNAESAGRTTGTKDILKVICICMGSVWFGRTVLCGAEPCSTLTICYTKLLCVTLF